MYLHTLEDTTPPMEDESPLEVPCEEPYISLHVLSGFSAHQTLKLFGYIKHYKVIVLLTMTTTTNLFIGKWYKKPIVMYVPYLIFKL